MESSFSPVERQTPTTSPVWSPHHTPNYTAQAGSWSPWTPYASATPHGQSTVQAQPQTGFFATMNGNAQYGGLLDSQSSENNGRTAQGTVGMTDTATPANADVKRNGQPVLPSVFQRGSPAVNSMYTPVHTNSILSTPIPQTASNNSASSMDQHGLQGGRGGMFGANAEITTRQQDVEMTPGTHTKISFVLFASVHGENVRVGWLVGWLGISYGCGLGVGERMAVWGTRVVSELTLVRASSV